MIYFDNASSTLVDDDILEFFNNECKTNYANPSSYHRLGQNLSSKINKIKSSILKTLKLEPSKYEVIFTSGATEANNLAIFGTLNKSNKTNILITSNIEHSSILSSFNEIAKEGYKVIYLKINKEGLIDINELKSILNKDVTFISLMCVNNEVGNILNLKEVKEVLKDYPKIIFHSDLAQTLGKYNIDFSLFDMFTISSYKIYGLKGIGALIKKKNIRLNPIIYGGNQQDKLRPGTLDYPSISTFNYTISKAINDFNKNYNHSKELHDYLINELSKNDEIILHNFPNQSPYIINFSLKTKKASVVIEALSNEEIYVSSKSSCNDKLIALSHVVYALTNNEKEALNSIRISFSKHNTIEDCSIFTSKLNKILNSIRS